MKAAVYYEPGPPSVFRYEDVPDPVAGPGEILVANEVITLEGGDAIARRQQTPKRAPHIVGYQSGGKVIAVGEGVSLFKVGDRAATFAPAGSHAALRKVPEATAWKVPDGLDMQVGANIPVTFGTADDALFEFGELKAGETVVVTGATGGVGVAAIQIARAAGATVIAVGSGDERLARLTALGAHHVIDYRKADIVEGVKALTGGRGAEVVIEMVGGKVFDAAVGAAAYRGRIVFVGAASGQPAMVDAMRLLIDCKSVRGMIFGREMATERARRIVDKHMADAAAGRVDVPIDRVFPLSEAAAAHEHLENGHPFGRVLMTP
jgi:NADPH2:quinone reductase